MRSLIRSTVAVLAVLALVCSSVGKVSAQEQETVTKTFKLTLYGSGRALDYLIEYTVGENAERQRLVLCGAPSRPSCESSPQSLTYSRTVSLPKGSHISFSLFQASGEMLIDVLTEGEETLNQDMTNAFWYNQDNGQGGQGDGPASGDDQQGRFSYSKTFKLTLYGTPKKEMSVLATWVANGTSSSIAFCGPALQGEYSGIEVCKGHGAVYSILKEGGFPPGTNLTSRFYTCSGPCEPDTDIMEDPAGVLFAKGTEAINSDLTNAAWYDFDTDEGGLGNGLGNTQHDDQQQDKDTADVQDDQQAGDDQQAMVTKTFKLTLYGDVPEDQVFRVVYAEGDHLPGRLEQPQVPIGGVRFCGSTRGVPAPKCEGGDGTVYTARVTFRLGTTITFSFRGFGSLDQEEEFHSGTETLNSDITNPAWYTFASEDAGDAQDDKQTGGEEQGDQQAGDEQEEQQDADVTRDDQQEVPEELPDTGAGAMAPLGTALPLAAIAAFSLLFAGLGTLLKRR